MDHSFASLSHSLIHDRDPRARILIALAFSLIIASSNALPVVVSGLLLAVALAWLAQTPLRVLVARLVPLNVFMLFLLVLMPLGTQGTALVKIGPLDYTRDGLVKAGLIGIKGNAILLTVVALLSSVDMVTLGHAFHHLRVPAKLVQIFLFTVRYLSVYEDEFARMARAARVRGFRPGTNARTLRAFAHLIGTVLVRAFDRAERVLAAMKCRGYAGRFFVLHHFEFTRRDALFCAVAVLVLAILAGETLLW